MTADKSEEAAGSNEEVDHELQRLRLKRMQKIMAMKKAREQQSSQQMDLEDKINKIFSVIMTPQAFAYFESLKESNNSLYQRMRNMLLPPHIMNQIDMLFYYLSRGQLRRGIIGLDDIKILERKILGIGPQIKIKKRNQETKSLSSFLKDDD